jgi:hypothetical protein
MCSQVRLAWGQRVGGFNIDTHRQPNHPANLADPAQKTRPVAAADARRQHLRRRYKTVAKHSRI